MPDCTPDKDPCDVLPRAGEAWSVCLPFGGRIWADGNGVHANGGIAPPDGVYGKVVIADGCIVGVEPEDVPLYTGSPCAPLPGNCGGSNGSSRAVAEGFAATETFVTCEIEAGAGVTVKGAGTSDNPYVISADTGIYIRSENAAINITGSGTRQDPFNVKHKTGLATTINGMTFDAFGHLTSANPNETAGTKGIKGLIPGFGIDIDPNPVTGMPTIGVRKQPDNVPGQYQLGGFNATLDIAGRVSAIHQRITIENAPIIVPCGATDLSIDQFGSIMNVTQSLNLGAGYLMSWEASDDAQRTARFTMRSPSALAGICFPDEADAPADYTFKFDGQICESLGKLFWCGSVFLAGSHILEVTGGTGKLAVLLVAVSMMEST